MPLVYEIENTEQNIHYTIAVSSLEPEQRFWEILDDNLVTVENWYNEVMEKHLCKFHELTYRSMQLGLMDRYIPIERSRTTQLDREIERLGYRDLVPWKYIRLPPKHPAAALCLVALNRNSDLNDVLARSVAGYKESRMQRRSILNDDFDSEDDMPLTHLLSLAETTAMKNKKAEEPMPDLPLPNWDENSEDEDHHENHGLHSTADAYFGGNAHPALAASSSTASHMQPSSSNTKSPNGMRSRSAFDSGYGSAAEDDYGSEGQLYASQQRTRSQSPLLDDSQQVLYDASSAASSLHLRRAAAPSHRPPKDRVDTFFDDFDDDREEDVVVRERLEEHAANAAALGPTGLFPSGQPFMRPTNPQAMQFNAMMGINPLMGIPTQPSNTHSSTGYAHQRQDKLPDPQQQMESVITGLRREWADFYRDLHLLKQFALLNVEAITKLLNKHDKNISAGAKHRFLQLEGSKFAFLRREHLKLVIRETEHVFAQCFTGGHRTEAMQALRVSGEAVEVGMATFRFGFFLGVSIVMAILICFVCVITDSAYLVKLRPGFVIFRMLTLMTTLMWSWGVVIVVCSTYRINLQHIFEFTAKPLYQQVFEVSAFCTLVITSFMLVYVISGTQQVHQGYEVALLTSLAHMPLAVLPLFVFLLMFITLMVLQFQQGWWGISSLGRVIAAPFFPITFQDYFTAEMLLSSAILLYDLEFTLCFFLVDSFRATEVCTYDYWWLKPTIAMIPSMWRTLQCVRRWVDLQEGRHLINAFKYAMGAAITLLAFFSRVFVSLGNFWIALWAIAVFSETSIGTYWDIFQDWNLGERQVKYPGLRSTTLLPARTYYAAMLITPVGRFLFALTISPDIVFNLMNAEVFLTILAIVEIARKTLWGVIRIENEQVSNAEAYDLVEEVDNQSYPDFFGEDILDAGMV